MCISRARVSLLSTNSSSLLLVEALVDVAQLISLLISLGREKSVSLVKYTIRGIFCNFVTILRSCE